MNFSEGSQEPPELTDKENVLTYTIAMAKNGR
jgi:hypothetical protein